MGDNFAKLQKGTLPGFTNGLPEGYSKTTQAKMLDAGGGLVSFLPSATSGAAIGGIPSASLSVSQMLANAHADAYSAAKDAGQTDAQAGEKAAHAVQTAALTIPIYLATGKLGTAGVNALLPEAAPVAARIMAHAAAQTASNLIVDAGVRAALGEPIAPTADQLIAPVVFGIHGGMDHGLHRPDEAALASRKPAIAIEGQEQSTLPDHDPEDVGAKAWIQQKVDDGMRRDEAVAAHSEAVGTTEQAAQNLPEKTIVRSKEGRRYIKDDGWYEIGPDGKTLGGSITTGANLRRGEIERLGNNAAETPAGAGTIPTPTKPAAPEAAGDGSFAGEEPSMFGDAPDPSPEKRSASGSRRR